MKMRNKGLRRSIVVISFIMMVILSACSGGSSDSSEASGDKPFEGETLNMIMDKDSGTTDLRDKWIPEFEEETGITVNVELLPESGYDTKLNLALASGKEDYDVVRTGVKNWSQLVSSDWLLSLDEFYENSPEEYSDGFSETLLETLKVDGNIYSMPYNVGADLLFYNKEMFEEAGLDPEDPPNDMEELIEYAEKLHQPDNNQSGFVARGTREGNQNSFSWIMMWLKNGGRWADDSGEIQYTDVLNKPEAVKTLDQYKTLMIDYGPKGSESYGFDEAQLAMQQGEAAMWLGAAQLGPALEDEEESEIAGKVGYHKLSGEGGDDYVSGAVWGFSMVKSTQNEDAAWELIQFLTSKEVQSEQVVSGAMGSPGRTDVFEDEEVKEQINPDYAEALLDATEHTNPVYSPIITEGDEIRGIMSSAISKVLTEDLDSEEVLNKANDEIKEVLSD